LSFAIFGSIINYFVAEIKLFHIVYLFFLCFKHYILRLKKERKSFVKKIENQKSLWYAFKKLATF